MQTYEPEAGYVTIDNQPFDRKVDREALSSCCPRVSGLARLSDVAASAGAGGPF